MKATQCLFVVIEFETFRIVSGLYCIYNDEYSTLLQKIFMNILCALYETFWNLINIVTRRDYRDRIDKIYIEDASYLWQAYI